MTDFSDGIDDILNKFGAIGTAQHILKGNQQRLEYDYTEVEDRLRLKLDVLRDKLKDLTDAELRELESGLDAFTRMAELFLKRHRPDEQPDPAPNTRKQSSGTDRAYSAFHGEINNPLPLTTDVDTVNFAGLIKMADKYGVPHNEDQWLDDDWPFREDLLRVAVAEAMEKVGK